MRSKAARRQRIWPPRLTQAAGACLFWGALLVAPYLSRQPPCWRRGRGTALVAPATVLAHRGKRERWHLGPHPAPLLSARYRRYKRAALQANTHQRGTGHFQPGAALAPARP